MYIHWKKEHSIGNELIDAEHQMLVMLIKKFDYGIKQNIPKQQLIRTLLELKKFTEFHFLSEENLMLETHYPGYTAHEKIHSYLLSQIDLVAARVNNGFEDSEEILTFLWNWLEAHIENEDMKIGVYLKQNSNNSLAQEAFNNVYPKVD